MATEWRWIKRYAQQFEACGVKASEAVAVFYESGSRGAIVETTRLALASLGCHVVDIVVPSPANDSPVPVRSTGASQAIGNNPIVLAALQSADFVADCTVEGLLHAPELAAILGANTRILMISNEHPENVDRWPHDVSLAVRVQRGVDLLQTSTQMSVTSEAGTDLVISLADAFCAGSRGWTDQPGDIAHWPGGLVLAFPAANAVNGVLVLDVGDVNLTFKRYQESRVTLRIVDDYIVDIEGSGLDAELFRSYLASFGEAEAYAVSHVGWGMNTAARWEVMAMWDKAEINGTELRAFAGNFLFSTGANEVAGRFCRGHFDLPMRNCTVKLDDKTVVQHGQLTGLLT